jgi:hypothetical protein
VVFPVPGVPVMRITVLIGLFPLLVTDYHLVCWFYKVCGAAPILGVFNRKEFKAIFRL